MYPASQDLVERQEILYQPRMTQMLKLVFYSFGEQAAQTQCSKSIFLENLFFTRLLHLKAPTCAPSQECGVG